VGHEILVRLTRGSLVESEHYGAYCVVRDGRVVRSRGDIDSPVFYRSAAKPIQAVAVIESGAPERYGLTDEELAMVVGSHSGSRRNASNAISMLRKIGESPALLRCGGHRPLGREVYEGYVREGYGWGRIEDNCSGKHSGMIAATKAWGGDPRTYAERDSRVQRENLANVSLFTGVPTGEIGTGTDGCAVPSFAVPLRAMAASMARFIAPDDLPDAKAVAARRVVETVARNPEMVAGPGRFDTDLARAGQGRILAKEGAEGVQLLGIRDGRTGIAIKVSDGGRRAVQAIAASLLVDLGLLPADVVQEHLPRPVLSREGDPVGDLEVTLG